MKATEKRSKQEILLSEIAAAADREKIKIYLYGESALAAVRGKAPAAYEVCVFASDVKNLIKALRNNGISNRNLEGMFNNPKYPSMDFKYSDTTTLDFNIDNYWKYNCNCLGVTVKIITGAAGSGFSGRRARYLLEKRSQDRKNRISFKRKLYLAGLTVATLGIERSPEKTFNYLMSHASPAKGKVRIGKKTMDASLFASAKPVEFAGGSYIMPSDHDKYLSAIYNKDWKSRPPKSSNVLTEIRDENYSWAQFRETIADMDFNAYEDYMTKWFEKRREKGRYDKSVYSKLLARTHDRFTLWWRYKDMKDEIISSWEKGDIDHLEEVFKPYTDAINKNYKRGLGLCFDPEIFEIYEKFLGAKGKADYAKELRALVPPQHFEPIRII